MVCRPRVHRWIIAWLIVVAPQTSRAHADAEALLAALPPLVEPSDLEPGSKLQVFLVTAGPGSEIWNVFGHNVLLIRDHETKTDRAYNYGIYRFDHTFIAGFLKGSMQFRVAARDPVRMLTKYAEENRAVWAQELILSPTERLQLHRFVQWNVQPAHRMYTYDYFASNCSTKLRDLIAGSRKSSWRALLDVETELSWRDHVNRLTAPNLVAYLALDWLMGRPGDAKVSMWDATFIPMELQQALSSASIDGHALVRWEDQLLRSTRPPTLESPPRRQPWFLSLGLFTAAAMFWLARRTSSFGRAGFALVTGGWCLLSAVLGSLLVFVWFTDHYIMAWNQNILLMSPLSWPLVWLVPLAILGRDPQTRAKAVRRWTALIASGVALAILLWLSRVVAQGNLQWILFSAPPHAALTILVRRL